MKDQHEKIKGYRDLTQEEIDLMNEIKGKAEEVGELIQRMGHLPGSPCDAPDGTTAPNGRWLAIAQTDLQKGFMALVRSVAKPTTF
jgi:hypothetical protein